jgi:hypothetical protein
MPTPRNCRGRNRGVGRWIGAHEQQRAHRIVPAVSLCLGSTARGGSDRVPGDGRLPVSPRRPRLARGPSSRSAKNALNRLLVSHFRRLSLTGPRVSPGQHDSNDADRYQQQDCRHQSDQCVHQGRLASPRREPLHHPLAGGANRTMNVTAGLTLEVGGNEGASAVGRPRPPAGASLLPSAWWARRLDHQGSRRQSGASAGPAARRGTPGRFSPGLAPVARGRCRVDPLLRPPPMPAPPPLRRAATGRLRSNEAASSRASNEAASCAPFRGAVLRLSRSRVFVLERP